MVVPNNYPALDLKNMYDMVVLDNFSAVDLKNTKVTWLYLIIIQLWI